MSWAHFESRERRLVIKGRFRRKAVLDVTIKPMSFASFLALPEASKRLFETPDFNLWAMKHLLPLFTNGKVPSELIAKLDAACLVKVWEAVNELNDFAFIKQRMDENKEIKDDERANPGQVLSSISHFFPAYTIEAIMKLPAQQVLALVADLKPPKEPENYDEYKSMSMTDIGRLMKAGKKNG